jgi:hypothetical protein
MVGLYGKKSLGAEAKRIPGMGIGVLQPLPPKAKAIPKFAQQGASLNSMLNIPGLNG